MTFRYLEQGTFADVWEVERLVGVLKQCADRLSTLSLGGDWEDMDLRLSNEMRLLAYELSPAERGVFTSDKLQHKPKGEYDRTMYQAQ